MAKSQRRRERERKGPSYTTGLGRIALYYGGEGFGHLVPDPREEGAQSSNLASLQNQAEDPHTHRHTTDDELDKRRPTAGTGGDTINKVDQISRNSSSHAVKNQAEKKKCTSWARGVSQGGMRKWKIHSPVQRNVPGKGRSNQSEILGVDRPKDRGGASRKRVVGN